MRDRQTIESRVNYLRYAHVNKETEETITIELLLDIRDLLLQKAVKNE